MNRLRKIGLTNVESGKEELANYLASEAMFHATALGRATNYIFKNCTPMLKDMHIKLDAKILNDGIKYVCSHGHICIAKVGKEVPKYSECMIDMLLTNWTRISEFDDHDIALALRSMRCAYPMVPNMDVFHHFIQYLRKISG